MNFFTYEDFKNNPVDGVYLGVPADEYRAFDAISRSDLLLCQKSLRQFKFSKDNPSPPTDPMIIGSAFHCLVLEPDEFHKRYAVAPEKIDRRTKVGKAAWSEFTIKNEGKHLLKLSLIHI